MEFLVNDTLSNTHYTDEMLKYLYGHFLRLYWKRFCPKLLQVIPTLQHIVYWRSQIKYLGSDMIRRNFLTHIQLNTDLAFRYTPGMFNVQLI